MSDDKTIIKYYSTDEFIEKLKESIKDFCYLVKIDFRLRDYCCEDIMAKRIFSKFKYSLPIALISFNNYKNQVIISLHYNRNFEYHKLPEQLYHYNERVKDCIGCNDLAFEILLKTLKNDSFKLILS